jgi:carbon-monoxide dehydrogenase large subunit
VIDALSEFGIKHLEMPMTSSKIWEAIEKAKAAKPAAA